jgi:TonB family protein
MNKKPKRTPIKGSDRNILLKEVNCKCPFCPCEEVRVLEIHHIDGNRSNNSIQNLIMLCPTCHTEADRRYITRDTVTGRKRDLENANRKKLVPFVTSELEAEFPGGDQAWQRYLKSTLSYPESALKAGVEGTVMVSFVVNKDGVPEDVKSLVGHPALRQETEGVLRQSPRWQPAKQNGRPVKACRRQPIAFKPEQKNPLIDLLSFFKKAI